MQHLELLSIYNNELRGLDNVIEFLGGFTYLRQLDLFGNPLSEEPYYRDRVIHGIP
jgi:Leucine-rich repeat (LRR) protein